MPRSKTKPVTPIDILSILYNIYIYIYGIWMIICLWDPMGMCVYIYMCVCVLIIWPIHRHIICIYRMTCLSPLVVAPKTSENQIWQWENLRQKPGKRLDQEHHLLPQCPSRELALCVPKTHGGIIGFAPCNSYIVQNRWYTQHTGWLDFQLPGFSGAKPVESSSWVAEPRREPSKCMDL